MRKWFRAYTRWTDRKLLGYDRWEAAIGMPWIVLFWPALYVGVAVKSYVSLAVLGLVLVIWQGWICTRAHRALKLMDRAAAWRYLREGRHKLPTEYRDTQFSSTAAKERRSKNG